MRNLTRYLLIAFLSVSAVSARAEPAGEPGGPLTLENLSIELERTECFGTCPVYRGKLEGTGLVTFEGLMHVEPIGVHVSEIAPEEVVALADEFLRLHFFDLRESYADRPGLRLRGDRLCLTNEFISDGPSTLLTLRLGERRKQIVLYENVPPDLTALAERIDRVLQAQLAVSTEQR